MRLLIISSSFTSYLVEHKTNQLDKLTNIEFDLCVLLLRNTSFNWSQQGF